MRAQLSAPQHKAASKTGTTSRAGDGRQWKVSSRNRFVSRDAGTESSRFQCRLREPFLPSIESSLVHVPFSLAAPRTTSRTLPRIRLLALGFSLGGEASMVSARGGGSTRAAVAGSTASGR